MKEAKPTPNSIKRIEKKLASVEERNKSLENENV